MRYIIIVDEYPKGYEEGIYKRTGTNPFHSETSDLLTKERIAIAATVISPVLAAPKLLSRFNDSSVLNKISSFQDKVLDNTVSFFNNENTNAPYKSEGLISNWELGGIIISDENLNGNYNLEPKSFFGCLFESVPKFNSNKFKTLMQAGGGSELIVLEKRKVPKRFHISGENGIFSTGIYTLHPKLSDKLIPLLDSGDFIKSLIQKEMITILVLLGAKEISIIETKEIKNSSSFGLKVLKIGGSGNKSTEEANANKSVRKYGESQFNIKKAYEAMVFTGDLPNFMSIFNAREHGNLLTKVLEETVHVSTWIDASVSGIINGIPVNASGSNSSYFKRYIKMEIEFFDNKKGNFSKIKNLFNK